MSSDALHMTQQAGPAPGSDVCLTLWLPHKRVTSQRLMTRDEVGANLALSGDQVQLLIKTRQITVIRMSGEERLDSRALDLLIETYTATAERSL